MTQPQDAADPFAVFETGEGAWPPVHESGDLLHQYRGARLDSGASIISESGADDNQSAALATQPNNDLATALRRLSLDTSVSVTNNSSLATFGSTFGQPRRLSHLPPEDAQHFAAMQYVPPPQLSGLPDNAALMIPVVGGLLVPPGESPGHTPSPDFNNNATPSPKTLNGPPPIKSRNVYIAALPIGFTDQHLAEMLGQFGKITSARMFNDTRRVEAVGRSYGFVLFERAEDAEAAVQGLSGLVIDGRRIQIRLSLNGVVRAPRTKPPEYGAAMSPSNHSSPRLTSGSHPATPSSSQHSFAVSPGTAHAGSPSTVTVPMPAYGARTSPQLVGQTPIFALPQPRTPTLSGSPQSSASGGAVLQQQQQMPGMMPYAGYVAPAPYYGLVSPSPGGFDPVTGQPLAAATAPYAPSSPPPGAYYQQHQHHHQQHHQPHHQQQHHSASPSVLPPPR